ncbi:MAG: hypothetical protein KME46_25090 [Brasilonema angustatum HA4187-MV1]|jgi:hypothetical protein|nr:hypothetical protein [Brasilonema angustatum HA4187-MV1]
MRVAFMSGMSSPGDWRETSRRSPTLCTTKFCYSVGIADLKYEFSFVMLNAAERNEASARFFASLVPKRNRYAALRTLREAAKRLQNDNSYPDSATPFCSL